MNALLLAAVLTVAAPAAGAPCEEGCDERGCWLLVYRYTVTSSNGFLPTRSVQVREHFDGRRFPTEEAAYCGARALRQTGVELPTLDAYGRDSNVQPESITPMEHLFALSLGIAPAHPGDEAAGSDQR